MLDDAINKLRVGKRRKRRELSSKKIEGKDEKKIGRASCRERV